MGYCTKCDTYSSNLYGHKCDACHDDEGDHSNVARFEVLKKDNPAKKTLDNK